MNELTPFDWFVVTCGLFGMIIISASILFDRYQEYKELVGGSDEK